MGFYLVLGVDEDIIQIHNNKDIEPFHKDFIDIVLKYCQSVNQFKKYYLILKVIVSCLESNFLLISFANFYPVICTSEIKLNKPPSLPQLI